MTLGLLGCRVSVELGSLVGAVTGHRLVLFSV